MRIALEEAKEAFSAGEFPVGCVFVYNEKIISCGKRTHSAVKINELDHAEMVALRNLYRKDTTDIQMSEITVYSTMEPCLMCFSTLIVNGFRNFVYSYEDVMGGGTNLPIPLLSPLYKDAQLTIIPDVLRPCSLELFKMFFSNPENTYLKNSLLAHYTLTQ